MNKASLSQVVNDKARKIRPIKGYEAVVPLKFDRSGKVVTPKTSLRKIIIRRLSLEDLHFLQVWRDAGWNLETVREKLHLANDAAERVCKKLDCFRQEDAKIKALAEIPTPAWIAAKHVENVYEGGRLAESEHRSLQELAKIQGAYKQQQAPTNQVNVFNISLTPEQEATLKPVFDTIALEGARDAA